MIYGKYVKKIEFISDMRYVRFDLYLNDPFTYSYIILLLQV